MWTIALSMGVVGLALILLLLAMSFSKEKFGIKTLFLAFALAVCPILAQICSVLIENYATGDLLTKLRLMATSLTIITVVVFFIFVTYMFIVVTKGIFKAVNPKKEVDYED